MTMELELEQTVAPQTAAQPTMRVSARLVAATHVLELSSQELQQAIASELDDNPALELVEVPTCRVCGTELHGSICPNCIQRQKTGSQTSEIESSSAGFEDLVDRRAADEDDFDPMIRVASEQTLAEKLLRDLGAVLPERDRPIAEYLIGSLD